MFTTEDATRSCENPVSDDDEIEVLEVRSTTTPNPQGITLIHQLSSIVEEVRSRELQRKSQESIISQLNTELIEAKEYIKRQEDLVAEASLIMVDQQRAIKKANEENRRLQTELNLEKKRRILAEGKLKKFRESVTSMYDAINLTISKKLKKNPQNQQTNELNRNAELDNFESVIQNQITSLSSTIQDKLKNWKETQERRKLEVNKIKKNVEQLSHYLSSNTFYFPSPSAANNSSSVKSIKRPIARRSLRKRKSKLLQNLKKWSVSPKSNANRGLPKHFRDTTKRDQGFFCICGLKYISRKQLNRHIQQFGTIYLDRECFSDEDDDLMYRFKQKKKPIRVQGMMSKIAAE